MTSLPPLVFPSEAAAVAVCGVLLVGASFIIPKISLGKIDIRDAIANIGGFAFIWALLAGGSNVAGPFFQYYVPAIFASGLAAVAAVFLALALYTLRRFNRGVYGALEIVGAFATIIICASTTYGSPFERAVALAGAVYFLVRGLDNAAEGGFWTGALRRVSRLRPSVSFVIGFAVLGVLTGIMVFSEARQTVTPPYMVELRGGRRTPVSPMMCGRLWIECDAAAWRENAKLRRGTQAERDAAELAADQRRWALDPDCKISGDNPACRWTPRFPGPGKTDPQQP